MDRAGLYRIGLGVVALAVLAGGRTATTEAANGAKFVCAADIRTLDPAMIESLADERGVLACFEGLTVLDPASGQAKPGAAESWETSADGRTWTFKLRDATWRKGPDASFAEATPGKVKASDFVYAWLRLLDRQTRSPHSHMLDVLPGVRLLSTERPRYSALDELANDIEAAVGPGKKTLTGEQVHEFLNNTERNPRRWLREMDAPEAKEILAWKEKDPYQAARATKLITALRTEVNRLIDAVKEAEEHVGKDRSFWAKDDKTLVVQTAGAAPWLPSLLARGPLVPIHGKTVDRRGMDAFTAKENFVCNGAFVSATEFPNTFTDASGERTQYKVVLVKNPHWRGAAGVTTDRVEILVNEKADEVLRRYALHEVAWVSDGGLPPAEMKKVRDAKAPTTATKTPLERDTKAASADLYDSASGTVLMLRFRCAAPMDKPEVRRALASLVDRDALAKAVGGGQPLVPTKRFVHPKTTGVVSAVATPTWDPSKAKALYGPQKFALTNVESFLKILALDMDSDVADLLSKAWPKGGIPDDVSVTVQQPDVFQREVDAGSWHVCVTRWRPDFDDPLAFLSGFTTGNQKGGLRWSNAAYDALIQGALDVAGFAKAPADAVKDRPAVKTALSKGTDAKALEELRRTLLAEAETILLDEAVVVPLWIPVETGILSPKARGVTVRGDRPRPLLDVLSFVGVGCE
jgi:ABC-type oligopeptide transport system substrate-binding subunit